MQHVKQGDLIAIERNQEFHYFLILSDSAFFGCQWSYAFHLTSATLLCETEILNTYGNGFHALIDFIDHRRSNEIIKISKKLETTPFQNTSNLKARIDQFGGGHLWYIYSPSFEILAKQNQLKKEQYNYPIASGVKSQTAINLIQAKWIISKVVFNEGCGQYPA